MNFFTLEEGKSPSNSAKFWTAILALSMFVVGFCYGYEYTFLISALISLLAWATFVDGTTNKNDIWIYLGFGIYLLGIFGIILIGIINLYEATIGKFNMWLNNKKFDKWEITEDKNIKDDKNI